jgi:hypothetical protein
MYCYFLKKNSPISFDELNNAANAVKPLIHHYRIRKQPFNNPGYYEIHLPFTQSSYPDYWIDINNNEHEYIKNDKKLYNDIVSDYVSSFRYILKRGPEDLSTFAVMWEREIFYKHFEIYNKQCIKDKLNRALSLIINSSDKEEDNFFIDYLIEPTRILLQFVIRFMGQRVYNKEEDNHMYEYDMMSKKTLIEMVQKFKSNQTKLETLDKIDFSYNPIH